MTTADFQLAALSPSGDPVPVLQVRGEIDATNAARLWDGLVGLACDPVVIDLSDVGYFDSAGFAVLDRLLAYGTVAVVAPPGSVVRTAMTLLELRFCDSIDAARAYLRTERGETRS